MPGVGDFQREYAAVFDLMARGDVRLDHLHVQDDKLVLTGAARSEDIRNDIWNACESVNASYVDLSVQLDIDSSLPAPLKSYTVRSGDTLSKIALQFYGEANEYSTIAEANGIDGVNRNSIGGEPIIPA